MLEGFDKIEQVKPVGRASLLIGSGVSISAAAAIGGIKEGAGPYGSCFDYIDKDDRFGQDSFEGAESAMQGLALQTVLEKRGGLKLSNCDAYLNVVGGLTLDEPSADLAVIIALASSYLDAPVENTLAAIGEVGLSGELRSVQNIGQRLSEIRRLGFQKCVIPAQRTDKLLQIDGLELIRVKNVGQALRAVLGK